MTSIRKLSLLYLRHTYPSHSDSYHSSISKNEYDLVTILAFAIHEKHGSLTYSRRGIGRRVIYRAIANRALSSD